MRVLMLACLVGFAPVAVTLAPVAAHSQEAPKPSVDTILQAMQIGAMLDVMHEEGISYGEDLAADLLGGSSDRWSAVVAGIYDRPAMEAALTARFAEALTASPENLAAISAFFTSDLGQRIVTLEIEARRALLDEAVEDAAFVLMQDMVAEEDPRLALLEAFVAAADLEEQNVVGALNANFAFMKGMAEAGGPAAQMTEEDMLADVWGQEGEVRSSTREWLYSYFALAYQPLDDADLTAYTAFWESEPGQQVNAALFAAFHDVFAGISHDLGRAAAVQLQGDDI
jgi:alkylhydroperoxidase/carboxymuconolactone decarboxylase family protein YurZ